MAGKSLPPVSAKVIADIEQFVSEFKRAENVARRTSDNINRELTDLAKKTAKKFELGDVGKDILKGAGLFGGFQIAQTAADLLVGSFREAAEHAKMIEDSTAKTLASTMRMIALRQNDDQRMLALQKDFERKGRELEAAKGINRSSSTMDGNFRVTMRTRDFTDEEAEKIQKLTQEYQELGEAVDKAKFTKAQAESASELALAISQVGEAGDYTSRKSAALADSIKSANARWEEEQKLINDNLTPLQKYAAEIEKIERLKRGGLNADIAWAASVKAMGELADSVNKGGGRSVADLRKDDDGGLPAIAAETEKVADAARDMGMAFSSAFEDAVIEGEKLRDVVGGLIKDIARMGLRMAVTNPILNAVFGGATGWTPLATMFGGARAGGGPVSGGTPYLVGEQGPELFVPGSSGGIVPNSAMGGGGSVNVYQTNNFASGVTRQEVAGLLPGMVEASKRAVIDAVSRGGGYRRAFA